MFGVVLAGLAGLLGCAFQRQALTRSRYASRTSAIWQPSTTTVVPLIQLARDEARKATTSPTSSARPKRPNGSSRLDEVGDALGIGLLALVPRPAGKQDRPGRHAVDADVVRRQLLRQRLGQADLGRLHRVVGHAAAGLAAEDRRDDDDGAAAAGAHGGTTSARGANRREQRLVERLLPVGVARRRADRRRAPAPTLLTSTSMPPKRPIVASTTWATPASVLRSAATASTSAPRADADARASAASARASSPRAEMQAWQPSATSARALASPRPRLEPVTMATLPCRPRSMPAVSASGARPGNRRRWLRRPAGAPGSTGARRRRCAPARRSAPRWRWPPTRPGA